MPQSNTSIKSEKLSNMDAMIWKLEESTGLVTVTGLLEFNEIPDMKNIKMIVEDRLLRHNRFKQKIAIVRGQLTWVEDELFNIDAHLHRIGLPTPCDNSAMQEVISHLMSQPLDQTKPLWQLHIIENPVTQKASFLARLHHSIGDGISLIKVLFSLTHLTPELSLEPLPKTEKKEQPKKEKNFLEDTFKGIEEALGAGNNLLQEAQNIVANKPNNFLDKIKSGFNSTLEAGKMFANTPEAAKLYKGKPSVMKKVTWSKAYDLKQVKAIRKASGATINEVLLSALTGAFRNHILHHNLKIREDFPIAIPVSLHDQKSMMSMEVELSNKIGALPLLLPVQEFEYSKILSIIKTRSEEMKKSPLPLASYNLANAIGGIIPKEIQQNISEVLGDKIMASVSNVPGPQIPLYCAGLKVEDMMFWIPQTRSIGMGVSLISYNGKVRMGITTDEAIVSDPEYIVSEFEDELQEMYIEICGEEA